LTYIKGEFLPHAAVDISASLRISLFPIRGASWHNHCARSGRMSCRARPQVAWPLRAAYAVA